jgi:hypothetical protein
MSFKIGTKPTDIRPQPAPAAPPPPPPPPPPTVTAKDSGASAFVSPRDTALRQQALTTTGASEASSLRTEVLGDGRANCLETATRLAGPNDSIVLMNDGRDGVGHALVRKPDGSIVDPNHPQVRYESLGQWQAMNPRYSNPVTVPAAQVRQVLSTPPGPARDALISQLGLSGVAARQVADSDPQYVKATQGLNFRNRPGTGSDSTVTGSWPAGTEFRVVGSETVNNETWLKVVGPDGREGYVASWLTEESDGMRSGYPYVLPAEGDPANGGHPERTGRPETAMAWAESWVGAGSDFSDRCLGFVMKAFGVHALSSRCPEMYNPGNFVTGSEVEAAHPEATASVESAYAAYLALQKSDPPKVLDVPANLNDMPDGSILFFEPSEANGGYGHVCILQRNEQGELYVLTSGWGDTHPSNKVQAIPLEEMISKTGDLIGYTTADIAFSSESFPRTDATTTENG